MKQHPGHPYPLGATYDKVGVNFALFAENATKVELCLVKSRIVQAQAQSVLELKYPKRL